MSHSKQKSHCGGGAMKREIAVSTSRMPALFRAFVALVLCMGLMVPSALTTNKAYAATDATYESVKAQLLPDYNHGTISVSSADAQDDVIELEVGETATITVDPYQHVQYKGCRMWDKPCPSGCENMVPGGGECFVPGLGCKCDQTPSLETADVTATPGDGSIIAVGSPVADGDIAASEAGTKNKASVTVTAEAPGETTLNVGADGLYFWYGASKTYTVKVAERDTTAPTVKADQKIQLRQAGDTGTARVSLEGASQEWADKVESVSVQALSGDDAGSVSALSAEQYAVDAKNGRITFNRTEANPVFSVAPGEGDPIDVAAWGSTTTYPQSKQYKVTVEADGYADVVGDVTVYTGAATTFSIIVDEDGSDETTDDRTVVKTYTKDEIEQMSTFQNGSSQCGMTGFRTFSAKGVALADLIASAGVEVSDKDAFKLDTTDDFGRMWSYSQLFGDRYFLQSIYDDPDMKAAYAELVASDDEAGATVELRKLLASKAVEDNSIAKPMISANYAETMISSDQVASAVLPTEDNTKINELVGAENQYRFTYGISLVQEDCTVSFAGEGVDVEPQTVKSHLMTSTENTTIRSTYWNNALVIYKNAAEPVEPSTAADRIAKPADPVREGYAFGGWYTDEACTDGNEFDFEANDGTVDASTTLYAKWVQDGLEGLESPHDYPSNFDQTYIYTMADAGEFGMAVTFDAKTATESNYDFIYVYDGNDNLLGTFSGTELAGKTAYVPQSDTVKIRLTSDSSGNKWGFKVTGVQALTENNIGLVGAVAPISAQFMTDGAAKPEPVVTYGAKTLVKGDDYTVTYQDNTAVGTAKVVVTGAGIYTGSIDREFQVVDADHPAEGATVKAGQKVLLRQAGDTGTARVSLESATPEWANAVESVTVTPVVDGVKGEPQTLSDGQYSVDAASGRVTFTRTADEPVFSIAAGEGEPIDIAGMRGTTTYPQSKVYEVSVKAAGYADAAGEVSFYTGTSEKFSIIVDEDGNPDTTGDQTVAGSWTADELKDLGGFGFQNGSSQCGMTGFRTFSGNGVSLADLLEECGVTVSESDAFLLDTSDHYGNNFTYDSLFGAQRYFLAGIYDDDFKAKYAELVTSDDEAGATVELRRLLAAKALEDESTVEPMVSTGYAETMISSDQVADAVLPTEENTAINPLVSLENQFRFIYGIKLAQDDCTVTFATGDGSAVELQTVKSHLMTSTENTTIKSSYWANALYVYRGKGAPVEPSTAADRIAKPADPVREGYAFGGWYTDEACTDGNEFDFEANDGTVDASTTLYAKWVEAEPAEDIDLGMTFPADPGTVSTDMGRNPAGKVNFSLKPSDDAFAAYQAAHAGATKKDMLQAWIDGITSVTIDGVKLEGKAFSEWKNELTNAADDAGKLKYYEITAGTSSASVALPVALFDTTSSETDTKTLAVESTGFAAVSGDVTYRNIGAEDLVVRVLDENGAVQSTKVLTQDQLKSLNVQKRYNTSANCGMAGLRSYTSEGVLLTDVLDEAGVEFGPGMTLKLRVNDQLDANGNASTAEDGYIGNAQFSYDYLFGQPRYYYPAGWDDTTTYPELGGKTIYSFLSQDMRAWKGDDEQSKTLAKLIGATKEEVQPILAWSWNEGVVAWGGANPSAVNGYNGYTDQETYRFLFGMKAADDGSITDDNTTFSNTYAVFGMDVVAGEVDEPGTYGITYNLDGGVNAASNPATYTVGTAVQLAAPTKDGYTFDGWYTDASFSNRVTEIAAGVSGNVTLYAKWIKNADPTPEQPATGTKTDPATGVAASGSVFAPGGSAADGSLKVSEMLSSSDRFQELKSKYAPANNLLFKVFDVSLQNLNGVEITDLGADGLTLTFPVGAEYNGKPGTIIHLHKNADGTVSEQRSADGQKVVDGKLSISGVKDFSEFVVMVNDNAATAGGNASGTTLTKTGDSLPIVPIACFGGAAALLLALAVLARRRDGMDERG